jgi:hypothetical protein
MIRGACLCGAVRFELENVVGPFEFCYCQRCRKSTGSAYLASIGVRVADYRLIAGREFISTFELPVRATPPGYQRIFCTRCGSPAPDPDPQGTWFEIPAGLLEDDPGLRPDRHIFVDKRAAWTTIEGDLPALDEAALLRLRGEPAGT